MMWCWPRCVPVQKPKTSNNALCFAQILRTFRLSLVNAMRVRDDFWISIRGNNAARFDWIGISGLGCGKKVIFAHRRDGSTCHYYFSAVTQSVLQIVSAIGHGIPKVARYGRDDHHASLMMPHDNDANQPHADKRSARNSAGQRAAMRAMPSDTKGSACWQTERVSWESVTSCFVASKDEF